MATSASCVIRSTSHRWILTTESFGRENALHSGRQPPGSLAPRTLSWHRKFMIGTDSRPVLEN